MRQRPKRMVREAREQEPGLSVNEACKRIGPQLGIVSDTLRRWCKQADVTRVCGQGPRPGEHEELKRLRREASLAAAGRAVVLGQACLRHSGGRIITAADRCIASTAERQSDGLII